MKLHAQIAGVVALVVACPSMAASRGGAIVVAAPGEVTLKTGTLKTALLRSALSAGQAYRKDCRYILVLDGPFTPERRAALNAAGVKVGEYLPTNACIADLSSANPAALAKLSFVRWGSEFQDAWKLDATIGTRRYTDPDRAAIQDAGFVALNAVLFAGADVNRAIDTLIAMQNVTILTTEDAGGDKVIGLLAPRAKLKDIARLQDIGWVEERPHYEPRAYASRWILQANKKDKFPLHDAGLRGEGQIIGLIDGWVSPYHCAFTDPNVPITETGVYPDHRKILAYNAETVAYHLHGTLVAGIAVGDAGDDTAETRGVAYLSRMVFNIWPGFTEESIYQHFWLHYTQGASIHSNSWGSTDSTEYDFATRAIDNLTWQYPDNLILFAVSNGEIILNPENAKNCLAVTSTGSEGYQDSMCNSSTDPNDMPGKGPTTDGRRKPEIAAPGCAIMSTSGQSCSVRLTEGTSMAAPAIAGMAALIRQYYTEGYYPHGVPEKDNAFTPSGMLLKAALLNATVDLINEPGYPNDLEGWGRLQADDVLYFPGDKRSTIVRDIRPENSWSLNTGEFFQAQINVTSAGEPLRITMAFHDAPAALQAAYAPVNDLDVVAISPSGKIYSGNHLVEGFSTSGEKGDPLNNVEQIILAKPETGAWTIQVHGRAVNVGKQGFALVASGAVEEFCPADFDRSGFLDTDDFDRFVEAFVDGLTTADYDNNGSVESDDYDAFVQAFEKGC
jgi:subtilisin family serine protease